MPRRVLGWLRRVGGRGGSAERSASRVGGLGVGERAPLPVAAHGAQGFAVLGGYRLDRQLGRGAMGMVYLGHAPRTSALVAIKTMALAREFSGGDLVQARQHFFREAEMAGRLKHPDIMAIFGAGEEQGLAFVVMEYVEGHDLSRYTQAAALLPVATVLKLAIRVARALAYAHKQGVVHRDIKPANVLVTARHDIVKVADFGIARITDTCRTRTGVVLGTPSFMSPEQLAGGRIDGRADLYSLGVVLFQLLTGALPHASESMGQLIQQIANEPAPDLRTLRPGVTPELARVLAKALEKRVELRYADGEQMAAELQAAADELAIPAPENVASSHAERGIKQMAADSSAVPRHNLPD